MENSKICRQCGLGKPLEDFRGSARSPDGYAYHCRDCSNARRAARSPKVREMLELRAQGLKRCSKCKAVKLQSEYYVDRSASGGADGLKGHCRSCADAMTQATRRNYTSSITRKKCTRCQAVKPIAEFTAQRHADTGQVYGYLSRCKPCASHIACTDPRALAYRARVMPKISARTKKWRIANPEKVKHYAKMRVHRKRAGGGESISPKQFKAIVKAQKGKCFYCQIKLTNYHIDHFVALSKGGRHVLSNLVAACPSCNMHKQAKDPLVFMMLTP